jgi:hypothetical protein
MRNGQTSKDPDSGSLETPAFVDDTASKTGRSRSVIAEEVKIATAFTPDDLNTPH